MDGRPCCLSLSILQELEAHRKPILTWKQRFEAHGGSERVALKHCQMSAFFQEVESPSCASKWRENSAERPSDGHYAAFHDAKRNVG